jgi:hypothetical protein
MSSPIQAKHPLGFKNGAVALQKWSIAIQAKAAAISQPQA